MDWKSFWDLDQSIYVNARHKDVHCRHVAEQIAAFVPGAAARVLDYGCGEALHAGLVAAAAGRLVLCDSARNIRIALKQRFAGESNIEVLSPEEVAALPDESFDLIVSNSVIQYFTAEELGRVLASWRRLLTPDGVLIVADVIPPDVGTSSDVIALLRYAAQNGFLLAALAGLARTALSPYRSLRRKLGIAKYTQDDFMKQLRAAGFAGERLPKNLEHNPARMTFRARLA